MVQFYKDIIEKLKGVPNVGTIQVWNNQVEKLEQGLIESMSLPALFVEVVNGFEISQLGLGVQFLDNLIVRVHVLHEHYNTEDGFQAQNFDAFILMQNVYLLMQENYVTDSGVFIRTNQEQDFDHNNLYHGMIDFTTTFTDYSRCSQFDLANLAPSEKEVTLPTVTTVTGYGITTQTEVID